MLCTLYAKQLACPHCIECLKADAELSNKGPGKNKVYQCDKCKEFLTGTNAWTRHKKSCGVPMEERTKYPCAVCNFPFLDKSSLIEYIQLTSYEVDSG